MGARPSGKQKKGADRGIDGRLYFHDNTKGDSKQISVFGEGRGADGIADSRPARTLEREKAEIGVVSVF